MALNIQDPRWYTLQVFFNQEDKVKLFLKKFATLRGISIDEVLVPFERVIEIRKGKEHERVKKLYPGYVFLRMRLYDEEEELLQKAWYFVRNTPGVLNFVGNDRPVALKEEEVARILEQAEAAEHMKPVQRVKFEIKDRVKIADGPFAESIGEIAEIDLVTGKMRVLVSLFGRETPVELEFWQAERIRE